MYTCRICNFNCNFKWELPILNGNITAKYFECSNCESLQIENPYWLDDVYKNKKEDIDTGKYLRADSAFNYINALNISKIINKNYKFLDFGSGENLLKNKLNNCGFNTISYDPYFYSEEYNSINDISKIEDGSLDCIICLEVLEHLIDINNIISIFKQKIKKNGILIISTGLYDKNIHNCDWNYLAKKGGQHITLWSKKAIEYIFNEIGFNLFIDFPDRNGFLMIGTNGNYEEIKNKLNIAKNYIDENLINSDKDFIGFKMLQNNPNIYQINKEICHIKK